MITIVSNVTAILLENQEKALGEEANLAPVGDRAATGFADTQGTFDAVAAFDPVLDLTRSSFDA